MFTFCTCGAEPSLHFGSEFMTLGDALSENLFHLRGFPGDWFRTRFTQGASRVAPTGTPAADAGRSDARSQGTRHGLRPFWAMDVASQTPGSHRMRHALRPKREKVVGAASQATT